MVLLVAYSAWVHRFELAFMQTSPKYRKIYIVDTVVDLFFAVDIVLTFFLAYIDRATHLLVQDAKKIVVRYGKTEGALHQFDELLVKNDISYIIDCHEQACSFWKWCTWRLPLLYCCF